MKESEASNGTKLLGLVVACQMGTSLVTQLKKMDKQADSSWDDMMFQLQSEMAEAVFRRRKSASE